MPFVDPRDYHSRRSQDLEFLRDAEGVIVTYGGCGGDTSGIGARDGFSYHGANDRG